MNAEWKQKLPLAAVALALWTAGPAAPAKEPGTGPIQTYDLRQKNPWSGKLSVLPLESGTASKVVSLAIPAGQELPEHTTPTPALLVLVEGEVRFVTADEDLTLTPGRVVHIPTAVPHRVVAVRDSQLILVK